MLELLRWTTEHFAARGIESARLDAECLLAHALGVPRLRLYLDFEKPVLEGERAGFRELVRRRAGERVPVSQLLGEREFWSMPLRVTPDVLTPRPETETLVAAALDLLPEGKSLRILEIGTGSGADSTSRAIAVAFDVPFQPLQSRGATAPWSVSSRAVIGPRAATSASTRSTTPGSRRSFRALSRHHGVCTACPL